MKKIINVRCDCDAVVTLQLAKVSITTDKGSYDGGKELVMQVEDAEGHQTSVGFTRDQLAVFISELQRFNAKLDGNG